MKKMNKRLLLTSGMMLAAVTIATATNTYAWFTMSNENSLEDFVISAAAASGGLEISLDGKTFYSDKVAMTAPQLEALDITSKDGVAFYRANFESDGKTLDSLSATSLAGVDYYETDIYFRTVAKGTIYLDGSSTVTPLNTLTEPGAGYNASLPATATAAEILANQKLEANKSSFGNFSRNYVASAARLSFQVTGYQDSEEDKFAIGTNTDRNETVNTIIEPDNDNLNLVKLTQNAQTGAWSVNANASGWNETVYPVNVPNPNWNTWKTEHDGKDPTASDKLAAIFDTSKTVQTVGWKNNTYQETNASGETVQVTGQDQKLVTIDGTNFTYATGQIQITRVTLRIWIEGQDNAAQTPLAGGKFITSLKFRLATDKVTPSIVAIAPAAVKKTGNIITWNPVTGASQYIVYGGASASDASKVAIKTLDHPAASYELADTEDDYAWYGVQAVADEDLAAYYKTGAIVDAIAGNA